MTPIPTSLTSVRSRSRLSSLGRLKLPVVAVTVAALLAGCAHNKQRAADEEPCNPVAGALIGGAVGALIGGDRNRGAGAAIGAGLGALACMVINYRTEQTKSAEQVGAEYRRANNNQLPPAPVVTAYRTETTKPRAKGGEEVVVRSAIEVVPGRNEPLKELREEFSIVDPKGVERSKLVKTPAPAGSQGGGYVSTLQFTFPNGVPPGAYQVQSRLFVNGKPAQNSNVLIQVALDAAGRPQVAVLDTVAPLSN